MLVKPAGQGTAEHHTAKISGRKNPQEMLPPAAFDDEPLFVIKELYWSYQ